MGGRGMRGDRLTAWQVEEKEEEKSENGRVVGKWKRDSDEDQETNCWRNKR